MEHAEIIVNGVLNKMCVYVCDVCLCVCVLVRVCAHACIKKLSRHLNKPDMEEDPMAAMEEENAKLRQSLLRYIYFLVCSHCQVCPCDVQNEYGCLTPWLSHII